MDNVALPNRIDISQKHEERKSMKVDKKYVRETIEEYHMTLRGLNKSTTKYPIIEINGSMYYDVDMTSEELFKLKNAIDMNDIKWTV